MDRPRDFGSPINRPRITGKNIPAEYFAILKDRERDIVIDSGRYNEMAQAADYWNREYQSTAYVAELWRDSETS